MQLEEPRIAANKTHTSSEMIIPIFEVKQDEEFVTVEMRVPHLKVSSFDFYIDKTTFKFYGKPYFLRLVFTKELVEDGREKASYDVSTGLLTVNLPKKVTKLTVYFVILQLILCR